MMKKLNISFLILFITIISCKKNNDDGVSLNPDAPDPVPTNVDVTVQDFMWKTMNLWYFWQGEVDNLSDTKFDNTPQGNIEYTNFLASEENPETFFNDKLLFNEDRFSFLNADYKELVQNLSGISKSNGLEFGLVRFSDSDNVFGFVRYIIPNSNAATKDIKRGDIFTGVNGQTITVNNFRELLFGDADTYTLNMADIADGTITDNGESVSLTKEEGLQENPILTTKTLDISGRKIGYIVYNSVLRNFDDQLNDAFGTLKAENVTDLVLDLRYNPGGSVNSSRLLASMVYSTNTDELYIRQRWNDKVQQQFDPSDVEDYFAATTASGAPINTLNLNKVYIIATDGSASASELVMNGLEPYVDVVHIGETTTGKNEFSITMVDDPGNTFIYSPNRENNINPNNSWGIQPLVGRNENADGYSTT